MALRTSLVLCALLALSACDSSDSETSLAANSYVLTVQGDGVASGSVTRSQAYSGSFVDDSDSQSFAILLGADPTTDDVESAVQPFLAFIREGGRPAVGTYAFPSTVSFETEPAAGTFAGLYVDPSQFMLPEEGDDSFEIGGFYFTTGGALTITESSATRLVGSFSGTVRPFNFMTGQVQGGSIQFEGRFNAVPSDGFGDGSLISSPASAMAR